MCKKKDNEEIDIQFQTFLSTILNYLNDLEITLFLIDDIPDTYLTFA